MVLHCQCFAPELVELLVIKLLMWLQGGCSVNSLPLKVVRVGAEEDGISFPHDECLNEGIFGASYRWDSIRKRWSPITITTR